MAKTNKPGKSSAGKHKPHRMVRITEPLAASLESVANARVSTLTEEVRQAIREYIEKNKHLVESKK